MKKKYFIMKFLKYIIKNTFQDFIKETLILI